jgi:hypothetical protein
LSVTPSTWHSNFSTSCASSDSTDIAQRPCMLELTFVSLVASPIFLKIAAWRDSVRVIYMQKLALIPLLALVAHPVHAHCPLSFCLIDSLQLWLFDCVQLIPAFNNYPISFYTTS